MNYLLKRKPQIQKDIDISFKLNEKYKHCENLNKMYVQQKINNQRRVGDLNLFTLFDEQEKELNEMEELIIDIQPKCEKIDELIMKWKN